MAFFDIGALITLGAFFLLGRSKGFAWQVAGIASLILGYIAARLFSAPLSDFLGLGKGLASFLSWLIIYIVVATAVYLIARGFKRSLKEKELDELDKHLGGVLGLLKGGLLVFLTTLVGLTLLPKYRPDLLATVTGKITARIVKILEGNVPQASRDALKPEPSLNIPAKPKPTPQPTILKPPPPLPQPTRVAPATPPAPQLPPPAPANAEVEEKPPLEEDPLTKPEDEPIEDDGKNPFRYEPIKPVKRGG